MKKKKLYSVIVGIISAALIFFLFGTVTVLIPNSFFTRMSPIHFYDYIFLVITSFLFGMFMGFWHYQKNTSGKSCSLAAGGTIGGLFSFGCAICNHLLVFLLGATAITAYFRPFQPILGIISVIFLSVGVYVQYKKISLVKESAIKVGEQRKKQ